MNDQKEAVNELKVSIKEELAANITQMASQIESLKTDLA